MPRERILVVDDETNSVSSLKEILSDEGYDVSVTEDGLNALDMIQSDPPDLLLLDVWLPGMDGIEVLKTVKTYHPEIEVLVMSGHGTIDTAVKATKLTCRQSERTKMSPLTCSMRRIRSGLMARRMFQRPPMVRRNRETR